MAFKRLSSVELSIGALVDFPLANIVASEEVPARLLNSSLELACSPTFTLVSPPFLRTPSLARILYCRVPILRHSLVASYAARSP